MPRDDFLNFVLDQLAPLREVEARRMFGGVGLYRDGVFFGILAHDRLYFKTDDLNRAGYLAEGMGPFIATPKVTLQSYYELPPSVLENRHQLCEWAVAAIEAQRRAQQKTAQPQTPSAQKRPRRKRKPS